MIDKVVLVRFNGQLHNVEITCELNTATDELLRIAYNKLERDNRRKHLEQVKMAYNLS